MDSLLKRNLGWVLGAVVLPASAQTFNTRFNYNDGPYAEGALAVERGVDGTYWVFGVTRAVDGEYLNRKVWLINVGASGEHLGDKPILRPNSWSYAGWASSADRADDGGYILVGSLGGSGASIGQGMLARFNSEGDTLWIQLYGDTAVEQIIGYQAKRTLDGGYILAGERSVGQDGRALLLKTDSLGNEEWRRIYGGAGLSRDFVSVALAPEGGYYAGGSVRMSVLNNDMYFVRTDALGNLLWQRQYGGPSGEPNAHVVGLADGNVLIAGAINQGGYRYVTLAKFDPAGDTLWWKDYGGPLHNSFFFSAKEISPGGDLIAAGDHGHPAPFHKGLLLRTTADGDSLWMRHYTYADSLVENGRGWFYDVEPTHDGGFIAAGVTHGCQGCTYPPGYNQDVWVVKVDSMGCLEPGCHLLDGIHEQITNLRGALRLWPNPVAEQLTLRWELPEGLRKGSAQLTVVNSVGQVVRTESVRLHEEQLQLDLQHLAPGLYHLHLVQVGKWLTGGSFVKE